MKLSLLIATKGRPEMLADTLESLRRCVPPPSEVVVVDGDDTGSAEPVVAAFSAMSDTPATGYVRASPGLPHQRNVGLEVVSGDIVVFADDDVEFAPDLFAVLARAFDDPGVVGATGWIVEPEERRFGRQRSPIRQLLPGGGHEGSMTRFGYPRRIVNPHQPRDVEFMVGCLMSARRELACQVGFDENLPGYGLAEDEDFSYRLSRLGRIRFLPSATVVHHKTGFRTYRLREFNRTLVVNRAYLFRKNFSPTPLARAQFAMLIAILVVHRLVNREWSGVRGLIEGSVEAWRRGRSLRRERTEQAVSSA
jgi:GT2 family glycosyltransferase